MIPTDTQVLAALARVCERQRDATPLAVWSELYEHGETDIGGLRALERQLHKLGRAHRLARHRHEGERQTFFRVAGTKMPLFCVPLRR